MVWTVNVEYDGVSTYTLAGKDFLAVVRGKYAHRDMLLNRQFKRVRFNLIKDGEYYGCLDTHVAEFARILSDGVMPFEIEEYNRILS